mgnify:CR=1 FL=1
MSRSAAGAAVALALAGTALAGEARIAIIIDDMGQHPGLGQRALALPGRVSYAFLPTGAHTAELAKRAHRRGRDVLLHQPMQPVSRSGAVAGGIGLDSTRREIRRRLGQNLAAVPHAVGVNNHQGSLITRHPGHMSWFMEGLSERRNLFFIDSRTTPRTVAKRMAQEAGVAAAERDVFLDHDREPAAIAAQFERLVRIARRDGQAVAIAHPHPETLRVLDRRLAGLARRDVRLVGISALVQRNAEEVKPSWHVSSSH